MSKLFFNFFIGVIMLTQNALATTPTIQGIQSISQLVIYPVDINLSKSFYINSLGFKLDYKFGGGPVEGYQLSHNQASITLLNIQNTPTTEVKNLMIHMSVKSIDSYYQQIQLKGVKITKPIENTDWGTRWFHVLDPNGLTIAFEEKVST